MACLFAMFIHPISTRLLTNKHTLKNKVMLNIRLAYKLGTNACLILEIPVIRDTRY